MIKVSNLSKTYKTNNDQVEVLKDVSVNLPETGFVCLLGKSGSGKTTFLNILGGIDHFDKGSIVFEGIEYNSINSTDFDKVRSEMISFVFQDENLLQDSNILDNLLFVQKVKSVKMIKDKLSSFGLLDKIDKFPYELSGGEKQRIAIIRCLLKNSKLLLVDEPTGNLDEENSKLVLDILKEVSKEKLVLMITHDKEYAEEYSDQTYEIIDKKIISKQKYSFNESSTPTSLKDIDILSVSKRDLLKISLKSLFNKPFKLVQYVFLFAITLFLLGLGYSTLFINEYSVASNTFIDEGMDFVYIKTKSDEYFTLDDFEKCEDEVNCEIIYSDLNQYYKSNAGEPFFALNYTPYLGSASFEYGSKALLFGQYPRGKNQVIISDYQAKSFIERGLLIGTDIDKVIGQNLPSTSIEVVGVYETDYNRYSDILNSEIYYQNRGDINEGLKSELAYKIKNFYSIIYVSAGFDYSLLGLQTNGVIENSILNLEMKILPISSNEVTDYSQLVEDENDIYISKFLLYEILSESDPNINNYQQFLIIWNNNEESITESIVGTTYTISFLAGSQKYLDNSYSLTHHTEEFIIKGIMDDDDGVKSVYLSSKDYNEGFTESFSLILPIDTNSLNNESNLKYIRNNGYYYDSLSSDSIIKYIESDGEVLSMIAFAVSALFIVFTLVLYNSLISRDVLAKKKLIGLLRSMGFRTSNIFGVYIFEVVIITSISFLISLALLPIGIRLLNILVSTGNTDLNIITFDFRMLGILLLSSFIFSFISLLLPYKQMTSISIRESIKVEE
ncbi:ABC transporter ATP-binding protein/permease [Mycoplasmatota bacterium]|nr:ABC transporter ATP-binding protein/permease [Mycoplasmatota bacterium]